MSGNNSSAVEIVEPYTVLAAGYDLVMDHVDYDGWAAYIYELIETFRPESQLLLELGCGTGSFALALQERGGYEYVATDRSEAMLKVARTKAREEGADVTFESADFTNVSFDRPVDVAVLLYDGLNYMLEKKDISRMFEQVHQVLAPEGLFIVDQSTPANSANNERFFEDEGKVDEFAYIRRSWYDPETHQHTTRFDITVFGRTYREEHVQRAYTRQEIRELIAKTPFSIEAAFAEMSRRPATEQAERIHWVLRKNNQ